MHIGVILPHTLLYGGVKRYLELGNRFVAAGHQCTIFTPTGDQPDWLRFNGAICQLDALTRTSLDVLITSEEEFLDQLVQAAVPLKIFYVISKNRALRRIARHKEIVFFANSTTTARRIRWMTLRTPVCMFGGVSMRDYAARSRPPGAQPVVVVTYGRLRFRFKGTALVVRACEELYRQGLDLKLLLFDTPLTDQARAQINDFTCTVPHEFIVGHPVERNVEIFNRAHIFALAERKGGWSNCAAEAMASGTAVVATRIGTEDFLCHNRTGLVVRRSVGSVKAAIRRLAQSPQLREQLAASGLEKIAGFDWDRLSERMLRYFDTQLAQARSIHTE